MTVHGSATGSSAQMPLERLALFPSVHFVVRTKATDHIAVMLGREATHIIEEQAKRLSALVTHAGVYLKAYFSLGERAM